MLVAAAVVPGPPALVPQLMGAAAEELDELRQATDAALTAVLTDLASASADPAPRLVVAGPGEPRTFDARGRVSFADFGRDVVVPALGGHDGGPTPLPTSLMVARYLMDRVAPAGSARHSILEVAEWVTTDAGGALLLGRELRDGDRACALVLVADGATCHGPKAPRAEDSRAGAYESSVCTALASGSPQDMRRLDSAMGIELGATGPVLWPALAEAATGQAWHADLLWRGAPYGVGWAVVTWRRAAGDPARQITDPKRTGLERTTGFPSGHDIPC